VFFFLYHILTTVLLLAGCLLLPIIMMLGSRFHDGWSHRLTFYPRGILAKVRGARPVWIHAASVGEVLAAAPLVRELKAQFPAKKIILSTFTASGNAMARRASGADAVIFLPLDHTLLVCRAFSLLDPSMLILLETEIWPNLLRVAHRRGIPTLLLSGRLSERSRRRYALLPGFFRKVVRCFSVLGMQTAADADRIGQIGADRRQVFVVGSLKHAVAASTEDSAMQMSQDHGRLVLVVGSSHRGEEELFLNVFGTLKKRFPELQMVLAPRHPQRFAEVEKLLCDAAINFDKKSAATGQLSFAKDILLLDTLGDLSACYAFGDVAFVGGSLVPGGGHNLLEPARFGKPVLFGPYTSNFQALAAEMIQKRAAIEVHDAEELTCEIAMLLEDPAKRREIGERARQLAADDRGVLGANMNLALRYVQEYVAR
jgi:3-deoxy-D-manno-octulosonic-acid transferase